MNHTKNNIEKTKIYCFQWGSWCSILVFSILFLVVLINLSFLYIVFSGVRDTRSLVLYVCFVDPCLGNQNPYIEEEQTTQWPKEKVQKNKQGSTKHTYKTKDRVTRTPLKTGGELRCSGRVSSYHLKSTPVFSGVRVTWSLVLYVCFVDPCLSFCIVS
jgi:hypothetical protein